MITKIIALWVVGTIIATMFAVVGYCFLKEAIDASNANAYNDHYLDCNCEPMPASKPKIKHTVTPSNRPIFKEWRKRFNNKYLPKN